MLAICRFKDEMEREIRYFHETEENTLLMAPRSSIQYFL